ncbi:MAG TPA: 50S ribosomal protein L14e [Nautiliaceae bacterium]|nr:50S ribosomal protein L14e [Nautiliaceae bacterium]
MIMIEIGRVVIKTAGRDARGVGVIIDILDENYVLVDGALRRKKVNIKHIELLPKKLDIEKNAPKEKILELLKKEKLISDEEYEYWINKTKESNEQK